MLIRQSEGGEMSAPGRVDEAWETISDAQAKKKNHTHTHTQKKNKKKHRNLKRRKVRAGGLPSF